MTGGNQGKGGVLAGVVSERVLGRDQSIPIDATIICFWGGGGNKEWMTIDGTIVDEDLAVAGGEAEEWRRGRRDGGDGRVESVTARPGKGVGDQRGRRPSS